MPILKFKSSSPGVITLDKLRMENITNDKRTSMLNRSQFLCNKYRIAENIYMARNDLFFNLAKTLDTSRKPMDAMMVCEKGYSIVFVPKKSYVFLNGRSVQPENYEVIQNSENKEIQRKLLS